MKKQAQKAAPSYTTVGE